MHLLSQLAFRDPDIDGIYLLTDGKPDTSTSLVLREVAKMNEKRNITVNTISFNCTDRYLLQILVLVLVIQLVLGAKNNSYKNSYLSFFVAANIFNVVFLLF